MFFTKKKNISGSVVNEQVELIEDVKFDVTDAINKLELTVNEEGLNEYKKLASKIGHNSPELSRETLLMCFKKHNITVYNYEKVRSHLNNIFGDKLMPFDSKYPKMKTGWLWYPVAEYESHFNGYGFFPHWGHSRKVKILQEYGVGLTCSDQYEKPIPLRSLKMVDKLSTEIEGLCFYVSDLYRSNLKKLDPFLMCGYANSSLNEGFVIDYWDEPDFKI